MGRHPPSGPCTSKARRSPAPRLSTKPDMRRCAARRRLLSEAIEFENGAPSPVGLMHLEGSCFAGELIAAEERSPCAELLRRARRARRGESARGVRLLARPWRPRMQIG